MVRQTGKATSVWSTATLPPSGRHYWEVAFTEYELRSPRQGEEGFVEAEQDNDEVGVDKDESMTKRDVKEYNKSMKRKKSKTEKNARGLKLSEQATKRNFEVAKGDFTVRDAYFVGVVNHTRTDDNGIAMNKGAWGIIPASDLSRVLRENGLDKALHLGKGAKRNQLGNVFGSGERIGCLADMDARPRTLQFYRDGQRLAGACVEGVGANVRVCACPYNSGVRATLCFSPPPEELEEVRRDLSMAMSPTAPEGRLAQAIQAAVLAGVPDVDGGMIAACALQKKMDDARAESEDRAHQLELVAAALGENGASKAVIDGEDATASEDDKVAEEPVGIDSVPGEYDEEGEGGAIFELRLNEHPLSLSLYGGRQIELTALEFVLCQPVHMSKCCTSHSIRERHRGCGWCCGECCWCCKRVALVPTPRVRVVGVELNSEGGQLFLALMRKLAADAKRNRCCALLQLGLCRCLSCGCVQQRQALGCELVEVRFNIGGAGDCVGWRQWWKDDPKRFPWTATEQDAIATIKDAVESSGQVAPVLITRSVAGGTVSLEEVKMVELDVRAMVRTFPGSGITELRLRRAGLDETGMRLLARATAVSGCLISDLCLAHNRIGDGGAQALAAVLGAGRLTKLDLTDNRIGDEGALALAAALRRTRVVAASVSLDNSTCGNGGGGCGGSSRHDGECPQHTHCMLRELYMYDNPAISPAGATALEAVCMSRGAESGGGAGLRIALAYVATPRHVDGKVIPGEPIKEFLGGDIVTSGHGCARR